MSDEERMERASPERSIAGGCAGALFAEWLALPGRVAY